MTGQPASPAMGSMAWYDDWYSWWSEVEIHAPSSAYSCRLCGAAVFSEGQEQHRKWHEARQERPGD